MDKTLSLDQYRTSYGKLDSMAPPAVTPPRPPNSPSPAPRPSPSAQRPPVAPPVAQPPVPGAPNSMGQFNAGQILPAVGTPEYNAALALAQKNTGSFTLDIPDDVTSDQLNGNVTPETVLSRRQSAQDEFVRNWMAENQRIQGLATQPVPEAITTVRSDVAKVKSDIAKVKNEYAREIENLFAEGGKTTGQLGLEVRKKEAERDRRLADLFVQQNALADTLQAELDNYKLTQDNIETQYQFNRDTLTTFKTLQDLTKPDYKSVVTNPETGEVTAIVQNPDGSLSTETLGNIGRVQAQKPYLYTGTYQDGAGNDYFYGVKEDGTISTQTLTGVPGSGGGAFTKTQVAKGASNAGLSLDEFETLPADTKNVFINNANFAKGFALDLKDYENGDLPRDEFIELIESTESLSDEAKDGLFAIIDTVKPPTDEAKPKSSWQKFKDFFGGGN